jgi:predicted nucleic acid-binding protein
MIIIDTDVAVDVLRNFPAALAWLNSISSQLVVMSGFSALELFAGCRDSHQQRLVEKMIARFEPCWPSAVECDQALEHFRMLHLSHGIGAFDILIAQTAIELGLPLHRFNIKHFQQVPGLTIIQPYTR